MLMLFMVMFSLILSSYLYVGWSYILNGLMILVFLVVLKKNLYFYVSALSFSLGLDMFSYPLIMLTLWTCVLMLLSSTKLFHKEMNTKYYLFTVAVLLVVLFLCFSSTDVMMFYVMFESSLIPTLVLIFGWGYQPERLQAGIYMLFYTLFASLPLLLSIIFISSSFFSTSFLVLFSVMKTISSFFSSLFLISVIAFMVKLPMYISHLWLPKAHVEAPISGSMILASVLLKLGGYGVIRLFQLFKTVSYMFSELFISISMIGAVMTSLLCLRQSDLKSMIAYSSVGHMGLMISSVFINTSWSINGAMWMMLSHGLCSSALFCLANISYERVNSRSMVVLNGMINLFPAMSMMWFLMLAANMSAPPSLNLLSEISIFISLVSWSWWSVGLIGLVSFFSASYSLYMYMVTQHGKLSSLNNFYLFSFQSEFSLIVFHWVPLNFIILKPSQFFIFS